MVMVTRWGNLRTSQARSSTNQSLPVLYRSYLFGYGSVIGKSGPVATWDVVFLGSHRRGSCARWSTRGGLSQCWHLYCFQVVQLLLLIWFSIKFGRPFAGLLHMSFWIVSYNRKANKFNRIFFYPLHLKWPNVMTVTIHVVHGFKLFFPKFINYIIYHRPLQWMLSRVG